MYNFTIPMALMDFVPVLCFGYAAALLQRDLYEKMQWDKPVCCWVFCWPADFSNNFIVCPSRERILKDVLPAFFIGQTSAKRLEMDFQNSEKTH